MSVMIFSGLRLVKYGLQQVENFKEAAYVMTVSDTHYFYNQTMNCIYYVSTECIMHTRTLHMILDNL